MVKKGSTLKPRAPREKRIAKPEETTDVKFRETFMVSEYRDLLEDLQDAPKGSTLKIARAARGTALKHIRHLKLKVLWGRKGDDLFIKIVGEAEARQPLTIDRAVQEAVEENRRSPNALVDAMVLAALAQGPMTLKELARAVGVAPTACAPTLSRMVGQRRIENEDGVYRKLAAA